VQKAGFMGVLRPNPDLALRLLRALDQQLQLVVGRLHELTVKDVPTRLADWLLEHCSDPSSRAPQTVQVQETKRSLASELGTSSETLSRTLAKFREQQLLSVHGRAVTLLCPQRLAQLFRGTAPAREPVRAHRPHLGSNGMAGATRPVARLRPAMAAALPA
jgi:CRP/FNR family transcriptional regulator, dissimilatory nitrate respiration regulator